MSLYPVTSGSAPQASDVDQIIDIFTGNHDIGNVTLAPVVNPPSSASFSVATQSGTTLGVGNYQYMYTCVTGYYKTDGTTFNKTGETLPSSAVSITTTTGNTSVKHTLPTTGFPGSVKAFNIYRTAVGGSTFGLVATVKAGALSYIDSTADGSLGAAPPVNNTTGTILAVQNQTGGMLYLYNNAWGGF